MEAALRIRGLEKSYYGKPVLHGVDLTINSGDFYALLGYNGAGKTTTIGIITDLVSKDAGTVEVFGVDIDGDFPKAKSYIGVVPQEININIFQKVIDVPVYQAGYYGVPKKVALERTEKYLKALGLWEKRNHEVRELSGGMKRRLMIVRALIHEPKLLILDEPTAGVDVELRKSMWEFIKELNAAGMTILLTTHYLEEVEALCRTVAIIHDGKIIEETKTNQLLKQLNEEVILLDIKQELSEVPKELQETYGAKLTLDGELEIVLKSTQMICEVIAEMTALGIEVTTFRNKSSRLEQLFLHLTHS